MTIEEYDLLDLARKAGALHLLPENADYYAELIRISAIVASLAEPLQHRPRISDFEWRQWINSAEPMSGAPEIGGDSAEGPFVSEVACFGGAYLTIPADNPQDAFSLDCLLVAIFHHLDDACVMFQDEAAGIALAGLWMSDKAVREAGLHRSTQASADADNGDLRWPHSAIARRLEEAVSFRKEDVSAQLAKYGVRLSNLEAISSKPGDASIDYALGVNPVRRSPFLTVDEHIVAVSPSTIVPALCDALVKLARSHGVLSLVVDAFRVAVSAQLHKFADRQRWEALGDRVAHLPSETVSESFFQIDADKVAAVYLVTDELRPSAGSQESNWWNCEPLVSDLEKRFEVAERDLAKAEPEAPNEILHLVVVQSLGRPYMLGISPSTNPNVTRLVLTADELRIFSLLNLNDSIALWHVAQAKTRLPRSVSFMGGGFLDSYSLFRRREKSFYFSDDKVPDLIGFSATGIDVRLEAMERLDPHTVQRPDLGLFGTVLRLQSRSDFPVYMWDSRDEPDPHLLVEGLPFALWVRPQSVIATHSNVGDSLYFHLADAIAFWLWQLTPSLSAACGGKAILTKHVSFEVAIYDADKWFEGSPLSEGPTGISVQKVDDCTLRISFSPEFSLRAMTSNNVAERELARAIVAALLELLQLDFSASEVERIVGLHAPLGEKRRFSVLRGELKGTVDSSGLPRVRTVESFEESALADALGQHLANLHNTTGGPIPELQKEAVCHQAVAFHFQELKSVAATLASEDLAIHLISRHEALIAQRGLLDITIATHLACFGRTDKELTMLQRDIAEVDRASLASRFLIEYVATCPPDGSRPLSLTIYDHLTALASEIARYGQLGDALHYGLAKHDFELLRSGRLALFDPRFERAMADFRDAYHRRVVDRSGADFHRAFEQVANDELPPELNELEVATEVEFGLPMSKLVEILLQIAASQYVNDSGVGCCTVEELTESLRASMGLDRLHVESALGLFSLESRADFLKPTPPFSKTDVFPWRFNRALSYLRKPIVIWATPTHRTCAWGRRALFQAAEYLVRLCNSGRLKNARSKEMLQYQGRIVNRVGKFFNDRVADEASMRPHLAVKQQIRKFSGRRLARANGDDIGDIDVLVCNPITQVIFAIEAKCFSLAKTPAELANERDELFGDLAGRGGAVGRHLERVAWLEEHLALVLKELAITPVDNIRWRVIPILVLDSDLVSPRLVDLPFPVVVLSELISMLDS
ncbi:hypothetical protein [Lacipirellula parvula]|uniref:NERD domain-containing protein n=1 Tax=Lacipirellula parvula TaxID=2650471 RepID=A0A5K7XHI9_9BACT|nr:hypothetical protein [Lacipirellula parvula]BBO34421.1 hypothetical protein PLANPX_4033 [Lacipirellula parvula]